MVLSTSCTYIHFDAQKIFKHKFFFHCIGNIIKPPGDPEKTEKPERDLRIHESKTVWKRGKDCAVEIIQLCVPFAGSKRNHGGEPTFKLDKGWNRITPFTLTFLPSPLKSCLFSYLSSLFFVHHFKLVCLTYFSLYFLLIIITFLHFFHNFFLNYFGIRFWAL